MARLIRPLRTSLMLPSSSSSSSSSSSLSKIVAWRLEQLQQQPNTSLLNPNLSPQSPRTYVSQTQIPAADGNLLRIVRHEIGYELERSPENQPVKEFNSFTIDDQPGQKWITLKRKFGANEDIKIEATMFGGLKSSAASEGDSNLRYQITLVVSIYKEGSESMLEILCSTWLDSIQINKLVTRKDEDIQTKSYHGPALEELDDELHDSLYDFLEERGINDQLAVFLHNYMKHKEKVEYIRWLETLKCFAEK